MKPTAPIAVLALPLLLVAVPPAAIGDDERITVLDDGRYGSAAVARTRWRPIHPATPPVEVGTDDGRRVLRLRCNFATNTRWRVGWDRAGRWNLAPCQRFALDLVVDGDRVTEMVLHLRSGPGWYGCHFAAPPGRQAITLARKQFGSEGRPAGWTRIDAFRLSILRGGVTKDRTILFGGLRGVSVPAHVAIYRNDAGTRRESGVGQYVRGTADRLDRLQIAHEILDDEAVSRGGLAGKRVAILPLNPVLPPGAAAGIRRFVDGGGRLICCYCLPGPLPGLLGVRVRGSRQGQQKNHAFAFRPAGDGAPIRVIQDSAWARRVQPLAGTQVRATWIDADGKDSREPAVTQNARGLFIGHVLTPPDRSAKDRLLAEMIGELWPGMWQDVHGRQKAGLGRAGGFDGADALVAATEANLKDHPSPKTAETFLATARRLAPQAAELAADEQFRKAVQLLQRAHHAYVHAYAASIRPKAGEFRGVWCHQPDGVRGMSWDQAIGTLKAAGFNAILPNMCWGHLAAYPGKVLPKSDRFAGDPLGECLSAARRHGVAVHVWKVNWRLWWGAPPALKHRLSREGRLQADPEGRTLPWLCPSHPANRKQELEAMVELAARPGVAGIHFDYIRYPNLDGCYCAGCRKRFEAATHKKLDAWPADVIRGPRRDEYLQFRRDNITALVAAVSEQARKRNPAIQISAAVFRDWGSARDRVGQDWRLWIQRGYLDFVCPMQYTRSAALFDAQCRQTLAWAAGKARVMPGIGATLGLAADGTLQQVLITRRHKTAGFVLFNYDRALLEHLAVLRLGATSPAP
jgi:uncharacterized lipoprotein YddW (UPF0748 family)